MSNLITACLLGILLTSVEQMQLPHSTIFFPVRGITLAATIPSRAAPGGLAVQPASEFGPQRIATPILTSTSDEQSTPEAPAATPTGPPLSLTLTLLGLCCALLFVVGVFVLGFIIRTQNSKKEQDNYQ